MDTMIWRPIAEMQPDDEMVIAACPPCVEFPEGRRMIWTPSILLTAMANGTPQHLRYPATHFMRVADLPPLPIEPEPRHE